MEDIKKMDRRTLKTRKAISEGLASLLIEKELRQITVQELADKVDIHRVTFYKHYLDIYDVYEQMEKAMLEGLDSIIGKYGDKSAYEFYPKIFTFIEEHPNIFKMVFSPNTTSKIRDKFYDVVGFLCRKTWTEKLNLDPEDARFKYIIRYHSIGSMAIVSKWVFTDFKEPKDFIIKVLSELDQNTEKLMLIKK